MFALDECGKASAEGSETGFEAHRGRILIDDAFSMIENIPDQFLKL